MNLSNEQLLSAIHFSPIPTAIGGSDGSIITFNKALEELIGYKRSEIKDVAEWAERLYPDEMYRRFVWKNIQQALDGKKQDCTEFTITCKDGSAKVVDFKTSFFQGGLMIQMMDITERRRIQALVQKKVKEQRLLLDTIDTQIWYLTDVETYGRVNRAHVEFLGLQFQDVAYKRLDEFLPPDVVEVCREGNVEIFETRQPIRTEEWIPNARGEKRLIRITKTPKLNQTGEVEYVVCAGADITDLRASEERFRMIAESTGSMIGVMDATGTYEYVNPAHRILGYEPEELMGASAFP
ncbi:MAG: PAS domain S-box protein [Desulfobacteraceae bacterium]